ncbi:transferrin-binding protein-like solute binding protein [Rhodobacteraceae bacterium SC52]|nr:transferrin-binding protein-like solute binding protein [Rhodobacteraceae bacterium SC52]
MKPVVVSALLLALSACGGGGGGSETTEAVTPQPDFSNPIVIEPGDPLPTDATMPVQISGTAIESIFGGGSGFQTFGSPIAATLVTSTNTSGDASAGPDKLRLTANGETVEIDLRESVSSSDLTFDGTTFNISTDSGAFLIQPFASYTANPMEYAVYGGWAKTANAADGSTASDKIRFGSFGSATPAASMPSSGPATYTGKSIGIASVTSGSGALIGFTSSDVTVATPDFNSVTIDSTNTTFSSLNANTLTNPDSLDFNATGTISGTGFTASPTNAGRTGSVNGQFYGPSAEEVGGTFGISGSNVVYGGAFGAKK